MLLFSLNDYHVLKSLHVLSILPSCFLVCFYVYEQASASVCKWIEVCASVLKCVRVRASVCECVRVCASVLKCVRVWVSVCKCVRVPASVCECVRLCSIKKKGREHVLFERLLIGSVFDSVRKLSLSLKCLCYQKNLSSSFRELARVENIHVSLRTTLPQKPWSVAFILKHRSTTKLVRFALILLTYY